MRFLMGREKQFRWNWIITITENSIVQEPQNILLKLVFSTFLLDKALKLCDNFIIYVKY